MSTGDVIGVVVIAIVIISVIAGIPTYLGVVKELHDDCRTEKGKSGFFAGLIIVVAVITWYVTRSLSGAQ